MTEWKHRTGRLVKRDLHSRSKVAQEIYAGFYNMMPEENQSILTDFIAGKRHLKQRLRLLRDRRFRCSDRETYQNFRMAVLMNIY
jgi:rhamnosyltransferase